MDRMIVIGDVAHKEDKLQRRSLNFNVRAVIDQTSVGR